MLTLCPGSMRRVVLLTPGVSLVRCPECNAGVHVQNETLLAHVRKEN